ncbi:MAG: hypothetical protein HON70_07080, partial [Lentisphaerae bacterium]|nr:hypothetical protein [Lentisphaerota bacterium]
MAEHPRPTTRIRRFSAYKSVLLVVAMLSANLSVPSMQAQTVATAALSVDWQVYTTLERKAALKPDVTNPAFDTDAKGWGLPSGFAYAPNGGRNGTGGLRYERTDSTLYPLSKSVVQLLPNTRYRFGAWIKSENVKGDESGASICLEFVTNEKWVGGAYAHGIKGTRDWTLIETIGTTPAEPVQATLTLYMRRGMTGTAWFDDVFIESEAATWSVYPIIPRRSVLSPGNGAITLGSYVVGKLGDGVSWADPEKLICRLQLREGEDVVRDLTAPVR